MSINKLSNEFYSAGKSYWADIEPTIDGMLGGYPEVTHVDIKSSMKLLDEQNFLSHEKRNKLIEKAQRESNESHDHINEEYNIETRALDCGCGIGRVTKHLLLKYFDIVDMLEQNNKFLDESKNYIGADGWSRIGQKICSGLQEFSPNTNIKYDCIWLQWVTGHLTDDDFVEFLIKCKSILKPNGIIVVKDNTTSSDESDADTKDSSITRPHWLFKEIFKKANLILSTDRKQYKMPKGLYPVRMFVLKQN